MVHHAFNQLIDNYGLMNLKIIFALVAISMASVSSAYATLGIAELNNSEIFYYAENASVGSIYADGSLDTLVVEIDASDAGFLDISIPRSVIDSQSFNIDEEFLVLIDGIPVVYEETNTDISYRDLLIMFPSGSHTIQIVGTGTTGEPSSPIIPDWVKENAIWWGSDLISDQEYVNGIRYLIQNDILILN